MLPNDPLYFSCVMKSSNYAVSPLVAVFPLSCAGRVMFHVLNTSLVALTHGDVALCVIMITSQPHEPPHVPLAHKAEK